MKFMPARICLALILCLSLVAQSDARGGRGGGGRGGGGFGGGGHRGGGGFGGGGHHGGGGFGGGGHRGGGGFGGGGHRGGGGFGGGGHHGGGRPDFGGGGGHRGGGGHGGGGHRGGGFDGIASRPDFGGGGRPDFGGGRPDFGGGGRPDFGGGRPDFGSGGRPDFGGGRPDFGGGGRPDFGGGGHRPDGGRHDGGRHDGGFNNIGDRGHNTHQVDHAREHVRNEHIRESFHDFDHDFDRHAFGAWNGHPFGCWWGFPGRWIAPGWSAATAWTCAGMSALGGFLGGLFSDDDPPVQYNYGDNVVYQGDTVYQNGSPAGSAEEYYQQARTLAAEGVPEQPGDQDAVAQGEWQPLGVFSLVKGDQSDSTMIFQLAINRDGVVAGNYFNQMTSESTEVNGRLDKKTQRISFTIGQNSSTVFDTSIGNLMKDDSPILVHYGPERTQQMGLVRLQKPDNLPK